MGRNWAIVIGINQYRYLQPLHYAVRDATAMRDYFSHEVRFEQVYYFSDTSPPIEQDYGPPLESIPTFTTLRRFLRSRFERPFLQTGDNLWFFFAGHGIRHEDRDYLMQIDSDPGEVERTAIPISDITERLRRSGADNVVLLIDACRNEGRRAGVGIGEEVQQGVITLFSCSPRESSYEVEALQQGAFTHALLQGLRLQGEGNCATVERLDQYLRFYIPELNRRYNKPRQTPYATIEPAVKYHLILLPQQATLRDTETLKMDAYKAETERSFELAEQFWIRVLAVSPADLDAIAGIRRLAQMPSGSSFENQRSDSSNPSAWGQRSTATSSTGSPSLPLSRRRLLQIAGLGSIGVGIAFLPRLFQSSHSIPQPSPESSLSNTSASPKVQPIPSSAPTQAASNLSLKPFAFDVITVNAQGQESGRQRKQAQIFEEDLGNGVKLEMVVIKGGKFTMGSPPNENDEGPQRSVTVKPCWMGKYAVTQAQWKTVATFPKVERDLNSDPSNFKGANRPVENISWQDAMEFCTRLSRKTGREYRLPSEAEWEYACRAGTTTPFHFGETITTDLVNYNGTLTYASAPEGEYRQETTEVGRFPPNAFGLYDMHGNVLEWCVDRWHDNYNGSPTDGSAWVEGGDSNRLLRGGSWNSDPRYCRSANRYRLTPDRRNLDIGFRVVCSAT